MGRRNIHTIPQNRSHVAMHPSGNDDAWNWDAYWAANPPPRDQVLGGRRMARRIARFIRSRGLDVRRVADVGCGPAITLFALAARMPECAFDGFDSSRKVLSLNRRKVRREGLRNLRFHHAELPDLRTNGNYDIVICIATLHYVEDIQRGIKQLHRMVRPGGYLVFNYPNRVQQAATRREARKDPVVLRRFALVLSGANLLTQGGIEDVLRHRPRSFWREVNEPPRWLNPCVVIPKP